MMAHDDKRTIVGQFSEAQLRRRQRDVSTVANAADFELPWFANVEHDHIVPLAKHAGERVGIDLWRRLVHRTARPALKDEARFAGESRKPAGRRIEQDAAVDDVADAQKQHRAARLAGRHDHAD